MNLYDKIEKAISQHKDNLQVKDNVQEINVRHAISWVMHGKPDTFCLCICIVLGDTKVLVPRG